MSVHEYGKLKLQIRKKQKILELQTITYSKNAMAKLRFNDHFIIVQIKGMHVRLHEIYKQTKDANKQQFRLSTS